MIQENIPYCGPNGTRGELSQLSQIIAMINKQKFSLTSNFLVICLHSTHYPTTFLIIFPLIDLDL